MSDAGSGDRLFRHGLFLLVMSQAANVSNVAFHMIMGRYLTADEYGILAALLNLMLVLSTPLDALRTAMAHFAGRAEQQRDRAAVRALGRRWMGLTLGWGVLAGALLMLARGHVASFFHLPSALPVQVAAALLPVLLGVPVVCGILQGAQSFVRMSLSMHGWGVVRLLIGFLLVAQSATASAGVIAHAVSQVFALVIGGWGLLAITRGAAAATAPRGVFAYLVRSLLMLAGFGVLMNVDVMLVRHYFPGQAGHFAWAATIGRSVIFLPMPIALAMFPKVITQGSTSTGTRRTLGQAVLMAAALVGAAVAAVWLLPGLALRVLYGVQQPDPGLIALVRWVCLAMSPLGLTFVVMQFELAQHRFAGVGWLLACAAMYLTGVALWHQSVIQIVTVLGTVSAASALIFVALVLRAGRARSGG